ncbi:chromosome transmission fidelity protein 18 homolog isoform X2 [Calonectris borealis]|uniref:chromosome transmission fidelity protein 18 homolog isoform X2 n=1 Tax=Calonectris borealis TaxID=1323832 RepID=UPI003F4C47CE
MAGPEEGPEDGFYQRFAAELEVLAELGDVPSPPAGPKISQFRGRRQPPEEPDPPGDPLGGSGPGGTNPRKRDRGCVPPGSPPPPAARTPKPKRQRLEAVKKLNFGGDEELAPDVLGDAGTLAPGPEAPSAPQTASSDRLEMSGMAPLQTTPPSEKKRVLKRPPILEDYINVTSTEGTRVFMVVRDDPSRTGVELPDSLGWNARRPLHLLGVPFSYLKEQVDEERRRRVLEASQQLTEIINSCLESETSAESPEPTGEVEPADEEESALHFLWVDKFTPRRYMELLSDDYTNRCLLKWLKLWDTVVFGKEKAVRKAKPSAEAHPPFNQPKEQQNKWKTKVQLTEEILEAELDQHKRPKYKVALLCGPPGLGKTTLAHVIAKHAGYNAVEMNASDDRSPEVFKTRIEAATQMKSVLGADEKPNCLIIDEIDGAPAASINVLLNIIHRKDGEGEAAAGTGRRRRREGGLLLRPIICICNDQYVPALRPLRQQSFLLNFPRTAPSRLAQRLCEVRRGWGLLSPPRPAGPPADPPSPADRPAAGHAGGHGRAAGAVREDGERHPLLHKHPAVPARPRPEGAERADGADDEDRLEGPKQGALLHLARDLPAPKGPKALAKLNHMQNLVMSMVSGITPSARSRAGQQSLVLEVLCLLLDIIAPKLRPVNTQLYSLKEKQQLADLISTMLAYNLTYHQERLPEGQYVYKLDPNVEDVCRFPELPARRQLTYQAKQLIAREIELEKMRRTEALLQARNLGEEPGNGLGEAGGRADAGPAVPPSHQQRLEHIVRRAAVEDKPETDFFGRPLRQRRAATAPAPQASEEELVETQMGKAVGKSDVWFRFNEGVSNAVRRNIYIKDLL